jgi:ABC-type uncharacterized transport system ATPase subunit
MKALPDSITRLLDAPQADDVKRAAEHLAEMMKAIHGGDCWGVLIDHDAQFITIATGLRRLS